MRKVTLPSDIQGTLLLHSMPGRDEPWPDFINQAQQEGVDEIVCLTPFSEIAEKSPDYAAAIAQGAIPFHKVDSPIENYGVPADNAAFAETVRRAARSLEAGNTVLVHCAGGIGRTGLFASCVLQALGLDTDAAVARVEQAGSGAETSAQRDLIRNFSAY